ncbi:MAG TPA: hypothetical protein VH744_12770, partial [Terriglobales bacterium]
MSSSHDTEITLGPGKVLAVFFALAAVCALFFGFGFRMGRASAVNASTEQTPATSTSGGPRPSAGKLNRTSAAS